MCGLPPVVMLTTALVEAFILARKGLKNSGSCVGLPSFGSRACKCKMAAPASAAAMAASAISSAVTGKCGDMLGRSEEHTSELQSLMRLSYAVFCLKKKNKNTD